MGYGEVIYGEEMQPRKWCHTLQNFIYLFSFQLNFLSPVSHGVLIILQLAAIKTHARGFLCAWFSLWSTGLTLYDQFLTSSSLHMNVQIQSTLLLFCTWFHQFDSPFWIYSYVTILQILSTSNLAFHTIPGSLLWKIFRC